MSDRTEVPLRRLSHLPPQGSSPEDVLGSALVDVVRHIMQDELQARLVAASVPPPLPWMTPPAAARASGVPVKSIRAWVRSGRIAKRLKNRAADPKQQKFLVNIDDVVAVAEEAGATVDEAVGIEERAHARVQEILTARAGKGR